MYMSFGNLRQSIHIHYPKVLIAFILALLIGFLSSYLAGIGYLPLGWALRLELAGKSAYGPEMAALFRSHYSASLATGGFAYPLPAMWLALPIFLLPTAAAKAVWCIMCFGSVLLGLGLLRMPAQYFLFVPLLWGVSELQNTVLLTGLLLIGMWAYREQRHWLLGLLVALTILAKPQTTALIAGALAIGALRIRAWRALAVWSLVLIGTTFILEPHWVQEWLASALRYNTSVGTMWLIAWAPLALLPLARRQWWSALALLQVCLFPVIMHHYALFPLVAGYGPLRSTRLAWLAVACSWASVFLVKIAPLHLILGLCYLIPLAVGAYMTASPRTAVAA